MWMALVALLTAGGLIAILYVGWSGLEWSRSPWVHENGAEGSTWQLRELAFLKAAYDRMQQDLTRPAEASASLHAEQERIVRRMAETAKLLPADAVPAELRSLLPDTETVSVSLPGRIDAIAAEGQNPDLAEAQKPDTAEPPPPDLRAGLRVTTTGGPRPTVRAAEFAIDPELRDPIGPEPAPERVAPPPRRKPRDNTGRNQP
jgi:hypothetical protein